MTEDYLAHHGVKGMKWGVRRYQNLDGSLTAEGKKRYSIDVERESKTVQELMDKDPEYRKYVTNLLSKDFGADVQTPGQKAVSAIGQIGPDGKMSKAAYKNFNFRLIDRSDPVQRDKFFKELSKKGIDAIEDVNDRSLSGYRTKRPLIVFNPAKVSVESVRELSNNQINRNFVKGWGNITMQSIRDSAPAIAGAYALSKVYKTKTDTEKVAEYRREHPNSKMSKQEILNSLSRAQYS